MLHDTAVTIVGLVTAALFAVVPWWVGDLTAFAGLVVAVSAAGAVLVRLTRHGVDRLVREVRDVVQHELEPLHGRVHELEKAVSAAADRMPTTPED